MTDKQRAQAYREVADWVLEHADIEPQIQVRLSKLVRDYADEIEGERDRLLDALRECETEIDNYIDLETPRGVHSRWDYENTHLKELNPARLALQEADDE